MRVGVLADISAGRNHHLEILLKQKDEIVLGRKTREGKADLYLGDGPLVACQELALQSVSREHATLRYHGGKLYLRDCSQNGTKVNGQSLGKDQKIINVKDILFFGSYGPVICISEK